MLVTKKRTKTLIQLSLSVEEAEVLHELAVSVDDSSPEKKGFVFALELQHKLAAAGVELPEDFAYSGRLKTQ